MMLAGFYWSQNNVAGMEKELELVRSLPQGGFLATSTRVAIAQYQGKMREARQLELKTEDLARQMNFTEVVANGRAVLAVWEALYGLRDQALQDVTFAMKDNPSRNTRSNSATVYALLGLDDRSSKIMSEIATENPLNTLVQNVDVPSYKAVIAIVHNEPAKAVDLLDGAMVYARADSGILYGRGWAYLQANQAKEAQEAFQRLLNLRNFHRMDPATVLGELGLARAYALEGNTAQAKIEYQNVLAIWKDADPEIPIVKAAKAEYAKLQ